MTRSFCLTGMLAALAVSCGVGQDQRVSLVVGSAGWMTARQSSALAMGGTANLAVKLRITNNQATPLSLALTHFVLGSADGYLYRAAPSTSLFVGGCNSGASVMSGATVDCTVLFTLTGNSLVTQVGYEFDDKASTQVRISVPACSLCGGQCVDVSTDPDNCGACGNALEDGAACQAGKVTCSTGFSTCGSRCVNLQLDEANCGGCGKQVVSGTCKNGAPECGTSATACGLACTNVNSDAHNCGRCGAECPSSYACINSQCSCPPGEQVCGNGCVDLLHDAYNCGACGNACSSSQYCSSGTCTTGGSGGSGGSSGGGCHVDCSQFGLGCCGSSCC